jgi:hypothetical protein
MSLSPSAPDPEIDQEIIDQLKRIASFQAQYPQVLFESRRAAFLVQVKNRIKNGAPSSKSQLLQPSEPSQPQQQNTGQIAWRRTQHRPSKLNND